MQEKSRIDSFIKTRRKFLKFIANYADGLAIRVNWVQVKINGG